MKKAVVIDANEVKAMATGTVMQTEIVIAWDVTAEIVTTIPIVAVTAVKENVMKSWLKWST